MKALLDTNVLSDLLAGRKPMFRELRGYRQLCISRVGWLELLCGAPDEARRVLWEDFLGQFVLHEIDGAVAREAVALRARRMMSLPDALVWATARIHGLLLLTRDARAFPRNTPEIRILR